MTARELWLRLTYPLRRLQIERELREEIATHLELRAKRYEDAGLPRSDALAAARRQFGNTSRIADVVRAEWGSGWSGLWGAGQDLWYVARQLRRSPGFLIITVLTIALGIGINTAAFTFYDAVVLKPLPVRAPAEMVRVLRDAGAPNREELTYTAYRVLRQARSIDSMIAISSPQSLVAVLPGYTPEDARAVLVRFTSNDYFAVLGVRPLYGRAFDTTDSDVAIASHEFWKRELGADPAVVGRRMMIRGVPVTILGVAPPDFAGTGLPAIAPDLWLSMDLQAPLTPGSNWRNDQQPHWQLLARLAPTFSLRQLSAELKTMERVVPDSTGTPTPLVATHATFFQPDAGEFDVFQQASIVFMAALALILGIAVVNLVNLVAARNAAREREMAVRLALGASRARIARQLASEILVVAGLGGALGLTFSWEFARALRDWLVTTVPTVTGGLAGVFLDLRLDWRIATYAALLSLIIGLAVGVFPAIHAARSDVNTILKQGTATAGRGIWGKRNLLLATQVAGCIVLLAAAGMLLRGVKGARAVDPGFDVDHLLVMFVDVGGMTVNERTALQRDIVRRIRDLPAVQAVTWSRRVPFLGTHLRIGRTSTGERQVMSINDGSASYFAATGLPILNGRGFTDAEVEQDAPVVVVSQSLAARMWRAGDPVGKAVDPTSLLGSVDTTRVYTVVGVTKDVRSYFLSRLDAPTAYFPTPIAKNQGAFLIRTRGNPTAAIRPIRIALGAVSASLPSQTRLVTMTGGPMAIQRLMAQAPATASMALALLGLALASVGVYGLISQIVTRRTREIGVHVALGARPIQVTTMVVRKTLRPIMWGAGVGLVGAVGVCTLLRSMITTADMPDFTYGAGAFNPTVFGGVLVAVGVVVIAACLVPARRAANTDPMVALRTE